MLLLSLRLTILRMRFRPRGIDMVVHVDANGPGHDLRNARIHSIGRRMQPCRPEQHGTAGPHRSRQEFSSRKTGIIIFQVIAPLPARRCLAAVSLSQRAATHLDSPEDKGILRITT